MLSVLLVKEDVAPSYCYNIVQDHSYREYYYLHHNITMNVLFYHLVQELSN